MKDILYDTDNGNVILYIEDDIVLDSSGDFYIIVRSHPEDNDLKVPNALSYEIASIDDTTAPNDLRPGKYLYDESPEDVQINQDWEGFIGVDEEKARVRAEIVEYREEYIESGIIFGGYEFWTRPRDRENIMGTVTAITGMLVSNNQPPTFPWSLKNGLVIVLEHEEVLDIGVELLRFINDAFIATRFHIIEMQKLDNRFDIQRYDYKSTMWPDRDLGGTLQNQPFAI